MWLLQITSGGLLHFGKSYVLSSITFHIICDVKINIARANILVQVKTTEARTPE